MARRPKTNDLPSAIIVDIDGTLAIVTDRSPYSPHGVLKDRPNVSVIEVARSLAAAGHALVIVSGRSELARPDTEAWLARHLATAHDGPFMRGAGDERQDAVIKREIYERDIAPRYSVLCVLDDRDQTVRMWRRLGLTCLQVAPGDF